RDRVDAAFVVLRRTQRRAVVVIAAPVPRAIPCLRQRLAQGVGMVAPAAGTFAIAALLGDRCQRGDGGQEEPAQPAAFTAAGGAHGVHAVVPVAGADQRQAMRADGEAAVDRARRVFVQARHVVTVAGREERVGRAVLARRAGQPWQRFVEYGVVTADAHVVHGHVDQPEPIVADAGADALAL